MRILSFLLAAIVMIIVPIKAHSFSLESLNDLKVDYFKIGLTHACEFHDGSLDRGLTHYDYEIMSMFLGLGWYATSKWPVELGIMGSKFGFEGIDEDHHDDTGHSLGLMFSISREFRVYEREETKFVLRLSCGLEKKWPDEEIPGLNENQLLVDLGLYLEATHPISERWDFIFGFGANYQSTFGNDEGLKSIPISVGMKYRF